MGLSKQAHGLPRFMMDCGWWRNGRRWRRPTLAEIGLHHAGVSFANEHGTDGFLPGPADDLAVALSLPVKEVRRTVPLLLARGALSERDDGDYDITGFLDHNPSRAEVEADRRKKQTASLYANHRRHHVTKNMTDPDCPFCSGEDSDSDADSESQADSNNGRKDVTEGRNGTKASSSSVSDKRRPASGGTTDDDVVNLLVEWKRQAASNITNPPGWTRTVTAETRTTEGPFITASRAQHPDWTAERHAAYIRPELEPPRLRIHRAAQQAEATA